MKIREKRRLTQNKGVSVKIRETWQVCNLFFSYADNTHTVKERETNC